MCKNKCGQPDILDFYLISQQKIGQVIVSLSKKQLV